MKKSQIKVLDRLWSEAVRTRDVKCLRCGKTSTLSGAHIFSRKHRGTRWDTDNGVALCYACHIFWAHREPVLFTYWLEELKGKKWLKELKRKHDTITKNQDYERIKQNLEEQIRELKGGVH